VRAPFVGLAKGPTVMKHNARHLPVLTVVCIACAALSCVSVKLAGTGDNTTRAVGVRYVDPESPFAKDQRTDIDAAWKNPKNGNLISYLSDCQDSADPSLDSIVQGALSGLSELHVDSTQSPRVQSREARRVTATGKVDGVLTRTDLLAFKRNNCIYILSYVGVVATFDENRASFDKFISGFQAP
jgi:hypothetical protein